MTTQDTTLPPLLAALKEKIDEAIKVSDDVGRSRGSNCYAQNTRAVVKICELQEGIARDLAAIASPRPDHADHVPEIAARLRHVAELAGCSEAVPEQDAPAVGAIFSVLGNIRRALEKQAQQAQGVPQFLANGARYKVSWSDAGCYISGLPPELAGRWVAFVAAEDNCHLAAAPQAEPQPEREPLSREQIEALPVWIPFVGLWPQSRQEIARAIERAHGIGTKGGPAA